MGGAFEMSGTTTAANNVDNLDIAATLRIKFSGGIDITGTAAVDYKSKNIASQLTNNFDFHTYGGDPLVGGLLAQVPLEFS